MELKENKKIASPKEIGDYQVSTPLSNKYILTIGYDVTTKKWFFNIKNESVIKGEEYYQKYILENKSFKIDLQKYIIDLDISKKGDARKLVMIKISEIRASLESIKSSVGSVGCVGCVGNIGIKQNMSTSSQKLTLLFNDEDVIKHILPSVGIINSNYYFGIKIPCKIPVFDESGNIVNMKQETRLYFIFSDHNIEEVSQEFQNRLNIKVKGDLFVEESRWKLNKLKTFIDYSGLQKNYKNINPTKLFLKIRELYEKYITFDQEELYDLFAIWDIGTYFFTLFDTYPYINLWGLKNSGKSKVMILSSLLSFNAEMMVNMTPAVLFRLVDQNKATLYIDEAENLWSQREKGDDDTSDIVALLNAGWMKGSKVARMEKKEDGMQPVYFDPYCPKMLASIKGLKGALESRCVQVVMVRTKKGDIKGDLWPTERDQNFIEIRNQLYEFALKNWSGINFYYNGDGQLDKEFKISNRDWQIWKPILCIAKLIDDELYKKLGNFAQISAESSLTEGLNEDSWDMKLYDVLLALVLEEETKIKLKDVKIVLDEQFSEKEKKPSITWIGRHLNKIGFGQFKKREGSGVFFLLSKSKIRGVLERVLQYIPTQPTETTQPTQEPEALKVEEIKVSDLEGGKIKTTVTKKSSNKNKDTTNKQQKILKNQNLTMSQIKNYLMEVANPNPIKIEEIIAYFGENNREIVDKAIQNLKFVGYINEVKPGWIIWVVR